MLSNASDQSSLKGRPMSPFTAFSAMNRRATFLPSLRDEEASEIILTPIPHNPIGANLKAMQGSRIPLLNFGIKG